MWLPEQTVLLLERMALRNNWIPLQFLKIGGNSHLCKQCCFLCVRRSGETGTPPHFLSSTGGNSHRCLLLYTVPFLVRTALRRKSITNSVSQFDWWEIAPVSTWVNSAASCAYGAPAQLNHLNFSIRMAGTLTCVNSTASWRRGLRLNWTLFYFIIRLLGTRNSV
jgi:hypothetical protein